MGCICTHVLWNAYENEYERLKINIVPQAKQSPKNLQIKFPFKRVPIQFIFFLIFSHSYNKLIEMLYIQVYCVRCVLYVYLCTINANVWAVSVVFVTQVETSLNAYVCEAHLRLPPAAIVAAGCRYCFIFDKYKYVCILCIRIWILLIYLCAKVWKLRTPHKYSKSRTQHSGFRI